MDYVEDWKVYLWKKLLLKSDDYAKRKVGFFSFIRNNILSRVFTGDAADQFIMQAIIELCDFEPPVTELTNIKIRVAYLDYYQKQINSENRKRQTSVMLAPSGNAPEIELLKPDPYGGLPPETGHKFLSSEGGEIVNLDLSDLKVMANSAKLPHQYVWNYVSFDAKLNKEALEKRLNGYIDAFIQGDLVAPSGFRFYGPRQQMERVWAVIQSLALGQGSKNLKVMLHGDVVPHSRSTPINEHNRYRFYTAILALERSGDITVTDFITPEAVVSISERHLKNLDPELRTPPAYAKFESSFAEHELRWYCPVCGDKLRFFENKEQLEECLKSGGLKKCDRGHVNKIMVIGENLVLEHNPLTVSEAMWAGKNQSKKKAVEAQVDKQKENV